MFAFQLIAAVLLVISGLFFFGPTLMVYGRRGLAAATSFLQQPSILQHFSFKIKCLVASKFALTFLRVAAFKPVWRQTNRNSVTTLTI